MSDDTAPSALTRLVPPLTIIALLVMIAAAIYHVVTLGSQPAPAFSRADAPLQPDYSNTQAWYVRPEEETDGGWKSPWGVDLLWLNDARNGYAGGWNAPADWLPSHIALEKDLNWIQSLEAGIGFYAPARRLAARLNGSDVDVESARKLETEDVLSALDHYVENDHKQRGFFLGGRGAGTEFADLVYSQRLKGTQPFDVLFGGIAVVNKSDLPKGSNLAMLPLCGTGKFPCLLDLHGLNDEKKAELLNTTLKSFGTWLDENAAKPAEPLPPIEVIKIAPINKPQHD